MDYWYYDNFGGSCVGCGLAFKFCTCAGPQPVAISQANPPLGWRCPVCGRGLAPHVTVCPCVPITVDDALSNYSKKGKFDELLGPVWISRTVPPEA